MMIGKVLAVALTIAVTVCADNCAKVNSGYVMMSDLTGKWCNGGDTATCDFKTCHCSNCCEYVKDSCLAKAAAGEQCPSGKVRDNMKAGNVVAADSNYGDTCCKEASTCESKRLDALKGAKYCHSSQLLPLPNLATIVSSADLSDYKEKCCVDPPSCDITCPAGFKDKPAKTGIKCTSVPCLVSTCCDTEADTCASYAMSGKTCMVVGSAQRFADPTKYGNAVAANGTDYDTQCCSDKATCDAFKNSNVGVAASGTSHQYTVTLSLLLAVLGRAIGKHL